jgi:hypothetical protein
MISEPAATHLGQEECHYGRFLRLTLNLFFSSRKFSRLLDKQVFAHKKARLQGGRAFWI